MHSVAEAVREAVRARPFLRDALGAGVVNYRAAAEHLLPRLDREPDVDTVAVALRRHAAELPSPERTARDVRVTLERGVGVETGAESAETGKPLLRVGDTAVVAGGDLTAFLATGDVDAVALAAVVRRLDAAAVGVVAAATAGNSLVVVTDGGARDVDTVEDALAAVPERRR